MMSYAFFGSVWHHKELGYDTYNSIFLTSQGEAGEHENTMIG